MCECVCVHVCKHVDMFCVYACLRVCLHVDMPACVMPKYDVFILLLLLRSPAISLGLTILGCDFYVCDRFLSNHWGSHIPSLWMVHAGCVFVAGTHPSWIWMSESFESVQWNVYVHRLDLGLYSHPKGFWGNGVRAHVKSKGKNPPQRRIKPTTQHQAGQGVQHTPNQLFQSLRRIKLTVLLRMLAILCSSSAVNLLAICTRIMLAEE